MRFKGKLFLSIFCCFELIGCSSSNNVIEVSKNSDLIYLSDKGKDYFNTLECYNIFNAHLFQNYDDAMSFLETNEFFVATSNFESLFENNSSVLLTIFAGSSDSTLEVQVVRNANGELSYNFDFYNGVLEDICFHIDCFQLYV